MTAPGPSLPLDALEDVAERIARHDPDALEGLDRLEPASGMAAAWVDGALWMARHVHGSAGRAELGWRLQQLRHQVDTSQPLPDRVAALLADGQPWSPSALAAALDSDKWQVSRAVARLCRQGRAEPAAPDPTDRRVRRYRAAAPARPAP